jgi:hypothetical protein
LANKNNRTQIELCSVIFVSWQLAGPLIRILLFG